MVFAARTGRTRSVGKDERGRQQARLFFGEDLGNGAAVVPRPAPPMRHLIAPEQCLPVAFGEVVKERPAQKDSRT